MNQLLHIHGGMTFKSHKKYITYLKTRELKVPPKPKWTAEYLRKKLGKKVQILQPRMPLGDFAKYEEWKIHFERHFPFLKNNIILVGTSLGGIFLAKYLSEHKFPKKVKAVYLVCPPFDNTLTGEDLVGGFKLKSDLSQLDTYKLTLLFSEDDDVVPIDHARKYREKLSNAKIIAYKSKNGHFSVSEFPEIIQMIKKDL